MNITLRQLTHVLSVARHGSFHRAARDEHISQPALSRSIQNLEQALGVPLFDRTGSRVKPTLEGEAVLRRAEQIIGITKELRRDVDLLKLLETDRLRVAIGTYAAEMSAVTALGQLIDQLPGVRIAASIRSWRNVEELVLQRSVDLGLVDIGNLRRRDDLVVEPLPEHAVVFFCRAGHPLADQRSVSVSQLESYPAAFTEVPPRVTSYRPFNALANQATGDILPHIVIEQFSVALAVVAGSDTLGVAAPVQIEAQVRNGDFCVLPFRAPWMKLEYGFISLRGNKLSQAVEFYMQIVRDLESDLASRNQALFDEFWQRRPATQPQAIAKPDIDGTAGWRSRSP